MLNPHLHPVGAHIDGNRIFPAQGVFVAHGPSVQILEPQWLRVAGAQASSTGQWWDIGDVGDLDWTAIWGIQSFWVQDVQVKQETGRDFNHQKKRTVVIDWCSNIFKHGTPKTTTNGSMVLNHPILDLFWALAKCDEYPRNSKCGATSNSRSPMCPRFERFAWPLCWLSNRHRVGANGPCRRHIFEHRWSWMV